MKNRKRIAVVLPALVLCASLLCGLLTACNGTNKGGGDLTTTDPSTLSPGAIEGELTVRVFQPHPAQAALWQALAADYKTLTGVNIAFSTTEDGTLQTLKDALQGEQAPGIILFTDPGEYAAWKDNAESLSEAEAYKRLLNQQLALKADGKPVAVPLGVYAFGVIYSKPVLNAYFALPEKATDFTKVGDITDFSKLESLVKDITKNKAALGIEGAIASPALKEGESAAMSHRLLSLPLSYEFRASNTELTGGAVNEINFRQNEAYKSFVDMMLANGAATPDTLNTRTEANALSEFANGKAAMLLGGSELWGRLNTVADQTLKEEDIGIMPAFMRFAEGEKYGLALEPQLYAAVNAKASDEDKQASLAFLEWLVSSDKGLAFLGKELNLLAPYSSMTDALLPSNPLSADAFQQLRSGDAAVVHLVSMTALSPGQEFREKTVAAGLVSYARGESAWEEFKTSVSTKWKEFRDKMEY